MCGKKRDAKLDIRCCFDCLLRNVTYLYRKVLVVFTSWMVTINRHDATLTKPKIMNIV